MNVIIINGKEFEVDDGCTVSVNNGNILINGKHVKVDNTKGIEIRGNVGKLICDCNVTIEGDNGGNIDCGGNCNVGGNVVGDIDAGGNVNCETLYGTADAGGNITIGTLNVVK